MPVHQPHGGARRGGYVIVLSHKTPQLMSRVSVNLYACERLSFTLRNARIACTTRVIVIYSILLLIAVAHPTKTPYLGLQHHYKDSICTDASNLAYLLDTSDLVSGAGHKQGNTLNLVITVNT